MTLSVAIVVGLLGLATAIVLKTIEVLVEGRGAWTRRSISADVALFAALPDSIREGRAGQALRDRIEAAILGFSGQPEVSDPAAERLVSEQLRLLLFRREVVNVSTGLIWALTLVSGFVAGLTFAISGNHLDEATAEDLVITTAVALPFCVAYWVGSYFVAVAVVRRRWRRRGRQLPAKYS